MAGEVSLQHWQSPFKGMSLDQLKQQAKLNTDNYLKETGMTEAQLEAQTGMKRADKESLWADSIFKSLNGGFKQPQGELTAEEDKKWNDLLVKYGLKQAAQPQENTQPHLDTET